MNERLKQIGRIATSAALIGAVGYGVYKLEEHYNAREIEIDDRCGGSARQECDRVEEIVYGIDPGPWGGMPYSKKVVRFVPKIQVTTVIEDSAEINK